MLVKSIQFIVILLLADFVLTSIVNGTNEGGLINLLKTRRNAKKKKGRSTSSSSGEANKSSKDGDESLELTSSESSSSVSFEQPKSSKERTGWRKWHRKCGPCDEDMKLKWSDPKINWICGAYQTARRSFKSACMMHLRNCQDGTMFQKIHDHRCESDSVTGQRHGEHFFYDYRVQVEGDTSKSGDTSSSEVKSISSV